MCSWSGRPETTVYDIETACVCCGRLAEQLLDAGVLHGDTFRQSGSKAEAVIGRRGLSDGVWGKDRGQGRFIKGLQAGKQDSHLRREETSRTRQAGTKGQESQSRMAGLGSSTRGRLKLTMGHESSRRGAGSRGVEGREEC